MAIYCECYYRGNLPLEFAVAICPGFFFIWKQIFVVCEQISFTFSHVIKNQNHLYSKKLFISHFKPEYEFFKARADFLVKTMLRPTSDKTVF